MTTSPFPETSPTPPTPTPTAATSAAPNGAETIDVGSGDVGDRPTMKIRLVGQTYSIRPPKAALALKMAWRAKQFEDRPDLVAETLNEFIDKAFSAKDAEAVKQRLYESDDDPLDVPHIMELMNAVMERVVGDPTT